MKKILYVIAVLLLCFACEKAPDAGAAKDPRMHLLPSAITIPQTGGTDEILFATNRKWSAESDAQWVKLSMHEGEIIIDHEIIIVTVETSNEKTTDRVAKITFTNSDGISDYITITQLKKDAVINSDKEIYAAHELDGSLFVTINANMGIDEITPSESWVKHDQTYQQSSKTLAENTYKFDFEALPLDIVAGERNAVIEFKNNNANVIKEVTVNQSNRKADITIADNANPTKISQTLIGFNNIYSLYSDEFWTKTQIKPALKTMGANFLRWPGGAPTNRYHWNNLNGQGWMDNWDAAYDITKNQPANMFTDLDEHIAICAETGATPLIGINQGSGLKWNKVQKGVDEAKALVKYCMDKGYDVNYYYLDNEPYHAGANYKMTWQEYAAQINLYAPAIKQINPNAKIIINWQRVRNASLWNILSAAHQNIDIVEIHWYWKHGEATFNTWKDELPMNSANKWYTQQGDKAGTYKDEITYFYQQCQKLGYDLELASLEWNVGPNDGKDDSGTGDNVPVTGDYPTKYENTIMQAEMMMQFIDGGLHAATFWPIFWPKMANDGAYNANRYLMDPTKNFQLSPSVAMFEMFTLAMGKNKYVAVSSDTRIYPLIVENAEKSEMITYTHSKSNKGIWVNLKLPKYSTATYELLQPTNTDRIWGAKSTQPAQEITYNEITQCYRYYLPAYSLGYLKLNK